MSNSEIDFSAIPTGAVGGTQEDWEPPIHKFFGKKLPNGKTEKEPVYAHQEFPKMLYAQRNGKITAKIVQSQLEADSLGSEWKTTPAAFGHVGAPSFEQHVQLQAAKIAATQAAAAQTQESEAPKRGRPAKVD